MREKRAFFCEISAGFGVVTFAPGKHRNTPTRGSTLTTPHFAIFLTESVNYA